MISIYKFILFIAHIFVKFIIIDNFYLDIEGL